MPVLRSLGRAVRDGWLMLGITVAMLLALEVGYRGYRAIKGGTGSPPVVDSSQHPYAREPWWPAFQGEDGLLARRNRYDPYRAHWPHPAASAYVNIDSAGRRLTVQDRPGTRPVFMLGGSTMWGFTARDSFTIPSLTARALARRGVRDVEVVNLAQAAYNSTQELNTLVLELVRGRRPAVAVFLDGYNDIATGWVHGEPGHTYGDESIGQQIELGRRGFFGELIGLGRHSALVARLQEAAGATRRRPPAAGPEGCGAVAGYYRAVTRAAHALGEAYGFAVVTFLQPVHVASGKTPTPWEAALPRQRALGPCIASIDSAMADRPEPTFHSLQRLFDRETGTVFVDQNAHLTEAANRVVADRIAEVIAPLLDPAPRGR